MLQEQREYVLDAMFEKRVQEGERVIELGDNGDYFYIVDRLGMSIIIYIWACFPIVSQLSLLAHSCFYSQSREVLLILDLLIFSGRLDVLIKIDGEEKKVSFLFFLFSFSSPSCKYVVIATMEMLSKIKVGLTCN